MYRRMLIPLDGSPLAEQALPLAKALAERFQSSVTLFRAIEPVRETLREEGARVSVADQVELMRGLALEYLEIAHRDFESIHVPAERVVRVGHPASAILDLAETARADLIVMATHGRTGIQRWVYGSVADKVLTGARSPLLLVRAKPMPLAETRISRILVPLDGSELAEGALPFAQELARAFDAEILLLRVWAPSAYIIEGYPAGRSVVEFDEVAQASVQEYLRQENRELQNQGLRVKWETEIGPTADGILQAVETHAASTIVMSTHGRSGLGRWVMGSVAERVLSASPVPVLLVRSGAAASS
ncbi:MAG: universal stress protein [Acidobacteriota bacterium]